MRRSLPESLEYVMALWTGCIAGALLETEYTRVLREAGFEDVSIEPTRVYSSADIAGMAGGCCSGDGSDDPLSQALGELEDAAMSAFVRARKPKTAGTSAASELGTV